MAARSADSGFYGYRDYLSELVNAPEVDQGGAGGALYPLPPANMRVFFPSLDGSPQDAAILQGCGLYPLILFAHGDCHPDPDHYLAWYFLPAQLARAGYVVAVPQLPSIAGFPPENMAAQDTLLDVLTWMRQDWEYSETLMSAPATGLAGHSYGGMHAGILARKVDVAGVVSLSGTWGQWTPVYGPNPITELEIPQLLTWGTGGDEGFAAAMLPDSLWDEIAPPKHRAVFVGGEHFDYLYELPLACRTAQGGCSLLGPAAFDLATMFFGRYLPPELWPNLPDEIPATLVPPPLTLTPAQQFYAGGYLSGLSAFYGDPECSVSLTEVVPAALTVPYVLYTPANTAANPVEQRGLVLHFSGASGTNAWVNTQSPLPGTPVAPGSQVNMVLATGPVLSRIGVCSDEKSPDTGARRRPRACVREHALRHSNNSHNNSNR